MYSDNEKKFYIILNRNHEPATLFNASCHLTAGITDLDRTARVSPLPEQPRRRQRQHEPLPDGDLAG